MAEFSERDARELARYRQSEQILRGVHRRLAGNRPPEQAIEDVLALLGASFNADRAYTFSVTADHAHSSCNYEWTSRPEYAIKHLLQSVDQRGLKGWLDRFDRDTTIFIPDVDNPPDDLRQPAAKFKRDSIKSIYVFGFYDNGKMIGYLGIDYVAQVTEIDLFTEEVLTQVASILNLFILRHEGLELWDRLAEALPSAMFIKDVDNDLRYAFANPPYRRIFGENIVGMNDYQAFGDEIGQQFRDQDYALWRSGKPFVSVGPQADFSRVAKGYYSLIKFPVTTRMNRRYIVGFITDISSEHALLEKSKAAETAKSMFLASMSHEIRTPLNAIIGLVDELRHNDVTPADRAEYLDSVSTASNSLLALINDVLDMSKIEAGQMAIVPVATDMSQLFRTCDTIFSENCRARGLAFECRYTSPNANLTLDAMRVKQILFNLIGNAVKFTPSGGITVRGAFVPANDKTGCLTMTVADTGIGIAETDLENVFGLFEQASGIRGTRVANSGTGLGLCLCRQFATLMNGTIEVKSVLGKGSTFTVTLNDVPYRASADAASKPASAEKGGAPLAADACAGLRVLIVDDVPMNLRVLGLLLKRVGIEPLKANGGAEALQILAHENVTHVLTDLWMPEVNGEDLARAVRGNPKWKHIRLAAQTADIEATHNFEASLFDDIIAKPITLDKVLGFLRATT